MRIPSRRLAAAFFAALVSAGPALAQNAIATENQLSGNPPSEWDVTGAGDASIQGFATDSSVAPGESIDFKIDTPASDYRIDVYRLGWYAGLGARKVATVQPSASLPQSQPSCLDDAATGLVDCGNWSVSASWSVPSGAVSGVYVAKLVREDPDDGRASHVIFVVRNDTSHSALLVQTSDTTSQAYNQYGGNSLYVGSPAGRAYKVSYNRPNTVRGTSPEDSFFNAEYPMLRWLERNGYDVSYTTGVDTDRRGGELLEHQAFLSVGHDEYWSAGQRASVEAARAAGVDLAFFSGNEIFWKTRWEPSIDGSATDHRTLVTYKETHANAKIDPTTTWTGTWRDPRAFNPEGAQLENALTGQIFTVNCCSYAMQVPAAEGKLRFWRDTSIATLAPGDVATLPDDTIGYESDEDLDNGARPAGAMRLSKTVVSAPQYLQDYGSTYGPGTSTHHLSLYRASSGALVFGAGTIQWSWGLDGTHERGSNPPDVRMQQATLNLFADMGVQPTTLQGDLVAATASSDVSAPSAAITAPANGATVQGPVTVSGTAADVGETGVIAAVEVSIDAGATWHPADGRESWSYALDAGVVGAVSVIARAVDDSGNVGAATSPVAFTVEAPACPCSLWDDLTVPPHPYENDGQPIELGVKFRSSSSGYITGIRFYKGIGNGGTHVGHLWSAGGAQLAEATFSGETASGWQTVSFASPVAITANTTYIASSFSASGGYAYEQGGFASAHVRGPLRALADGEDGPNGVYNYGSSGFPASTFAASNYFVDVVFADALPSYTGFSDAQSPGNPAVTDNTPIEVGVKFQVDVPGTITALRFYKGAANTGTHVGNLWSAGGASLATATYTDESASGWQEVALATPVAVAPGQTYVASYFSSSGYFAIDGGYFANEVAASPLRFPSSSAAGGNGVYVYSGTSAFPGNSGNGSNYWIDVRFAPEAGFDGTAPTVASVTPVNGATNVALGANATASFSEPLDAASVTSASFELRGPGATLVAASVGYSGTTAVLDPSAALIPLTTYTATVKGGASGVTDVAGNPLAADHSWSFTTAAPPPPPPDQGPGGPILVVSGAGNPFGRYMAEVLRNEGFNAFDVIDLPALDAAALASHALVILGETPLSPAQVTLLSNWVDGGGRLVALRPDAQLATLLGVTPSAGALADAYLKIDATQAPGTGIVADSMQFHGTADFYDLAGARAVATLWSDASTATPHPAVTLNTVGSGAAAAFTYDLARSVVLTRQGNPAWAGQERDGVTPRRSDDLFFGAAAGDAQPDWVDLAKVAIPQADEQQRLLANLVEQMLGETLPMPRFWYLPGDHKAAVVLTGDQHGCCDGTRNRFNANLAADPPGCSVTDWTCVRSTSYVYPGPGMSSAEILGFEAQGFEFGAHVSTGCGDFTTASLANNFTTDLANFTSAYPGVPLPVTNRTHCIAWSDWVGEPLAEYANGIRFDTNYYYWPGSWILDRPGLFTGSGLPMRFADLDGTMLDVYQAATQITDESGQDIANHAAVLMDRAQGAEGYYAVITANMHTDGGSEPGASAIVAAAQARGVPVVSAKQMLEWIDGRNASSFSALVWNGTTLTFSLAQAPGAHNLRAMLPNATAAGSLTSLLRDGQPIAVTVATIKGVDYALFDAASGAYEASYAADLAPPAISAVAVAPAGDGTALVTWTTDEAATSHVDFGTSAAALTSFVAPPGLTTSHAVTLGGLTSGATYYFRVTSADAFANAATSPAAPAAPLSFATPVAPCLADTSAADFAAGSSDAGARATGDGAVELAQTLDEDFAGAALPAGWSGDVWQSGGAYTVAGDALSVDGAFVGTDAYYAAGRTLEFDATFGAEAFQHMGLGVDYNTVGAWAMFSTGTDGASVKARSLGAGGGIDTVVGAVGAPHHYRIDWMPASIEFRIDGVLVATHANAIGDAMRPLASDYNPGGAPLVVDDVHMTPYVPAGRFESRIADAGALATWGAVDWTSAVPGGTSAAVALRAGNTPTPDATWTAFVPLATSGATAGVEGRFAQYAVDLATADPFATPRFDSIQAACVRAIDSDGDGLLDANETNTGSYVSPTDTGSNPFAADSDGDGVPDGVEVARGSDPNDADSTPPPIAGAYLFDLGGWSQVFVPTRALAVARDGASVAGIGDRGLGDEGFVWTLESGLVATGDLAGGAYASEIDAIANGGAIAVGTATSSSGTEAVVRSGGVLTGLGDLAGGAFESHANDVSADGSVVVGSGSNAAGSEAFRWTQAGGFVALGHLAGGGAVSEATAVSADGTILVGSSDSVSGPQAFKWSPGFGLTPIGDIAGGGFESHAYGVSPEGAVIVGSGTSASGTEAFRWKNGAFRALGDLAGGGFASVARGASNDGRVIVGSGTTAAGEEAFVWTAATGMRRLADVIAVDFALDMSGWDRLISAESVSADGRVIAGYGLRGGVERSFVVVLDGPCSNGIDDDGDTLADFPADIGCSSPIDVSELSDCADGIDNDGDGLADRPADPSCASTAKSAHESTQCSNGVDDDGDGKVDFPTDNLCRNRADDDESSNPACGFGAELAFVLAGLRALRRRSSRLA